MRLILLWLGGIGTALTLAGCCGNPPTGTFIEVWEPNEESVMDEEAVAALRQRYEDLGIVPQITLQDKYFTWQSSELENGVCCNLYEGTYKGSSQEMTLTITHVNGNPLSKREVIKRTWELEPCHDVIREIEGEGWTIRWRREGSEAADTTPADPEPEADSPLLSFRSECAWTG